MRKMNAATGGITKAARWTHAADDADPAREYVPVSQEMHEVLPVNGELGGVWPGECKLMIGVQTLGIIYRSPSGGTLQKIEEEDFSRGIPILLKIIVNLVLNN